jgi:hypothetical protein
MLPGESRDQAEWQAGDWVDVRAELERIRRDRTYFNENYLYIRTKGLVGSPVLQKLKYNNTQTSLDRVVSEIEAKGEPIRIVILKARQEGVSTYTEAYIFKKTILNKFTKSIVVAHDKDSAIGLFQMSQLFYDYLPSEMRPMKRFSNRRELLFENPDDKARPSKPGLRSHMFVGTANNFELGRSTTINHAHLSEFAFWPNPDATMLSLMQAIPDAPHTSVFVESTANGQGNAYHRLYRGAREGKNEFKCIFFPWYIDPQYRMPLYGDPLEPDEYELWLMEKCGCDLEQLTWRRWTIRNKCGGDLNLFKQEYPATDDEAFLATGSSVFDLGIVAKMLREVGEPRVGEILINPKSRVISFVDAPDGHLSIWRGPEKDKTYIIGADVAEGVKDGNYSAAEVLCRETFEQVAEWHGHIEPDRFASILANLGLYFHTALIACENNGPGVATIGRLRDLYWNLYSTINIDQANRTQSKKLGWTTSIRTRPLLINGIQKAMAEGDLKVNSSRLLDEMNTFVYMQVGVMKQGPIKLRPEAQTGNYDDCIMAMGIAIQAHVQYPMMDILGDRREQEALMEQEMLELPSTNMKEREQKKLALLVDPEFKNRGLIDEHLGEW